MIDGPSPLPDSQLKASSSLSPSSGPQSARLSSKSAANSAGAWTADVADDRQFIEVDLGQTRGVYGIVTSGREGFGEWVSSYHLLHSSDGVAYAYYPDEDGSHKIFPANFDSTSEVQQILERPFEARFVRLEPVTWEGHISLRFDVLGCSEALATSTEAPPTYAKRVQATMPEEEVCKDPMGLENGLISDSQLSASSSYDDESLTPEHGRLGSNSAWTAAELDDKQYFQIDFLEPRNVTSVITRGRPGVPQWVSAYLVAYSNDGKVWNKVHNHIGQIQEFAGNYDEDTPVTNQLPATLRTRYLRIQPTKWKNWISLQAEVLGCFHPYQCRDPMGLENGLVANAQLTASSVYDLSVASVNGRLGTTTAWSAATLDKNQYLQIDFLERFNLTGVVTKGRKDVPQWVTAFQVAHSDDGIHWNKIKDDFGIVMEFPGNTDKDSAVTNLFPEAVNARFLRILPTKWKSWISLRAEIIGCYHPQVCKEPMGLENGLLADVQLSASSAYDDSLTPANARLGDETAWAAAILDDKQYLQIDFLAPRNITGVVTKGRQDSPQWVKAYKLRVSDDADTWTPIVNDLGDEIEFPANKDQQSAVTNLLPEEMITRYLRIIPTQWEGWISLQVEVLGCYHPEVCQEPMGLENGLISDVQLSASSSYDLNLTPDQARLGSDKAWASGKLDDRQYLQIDFLEPRNLTAVVTRGRNDAAQWVTAYRVSYSDDGESFALVRNDEGEIQEYQANSDSDSSVVNVFPEILTTRYLRIHPIRWKSWISLRADVLGCFHPYSCKDPMGLENGLMSDSQISASSFLDKVSTPTAARLNSDTAWAAAELDEDQYLEIDFLEPRNLSAIITKGRHNDDEWVTAYQVAYSDDGENWQVVTDDVGKAQEFPGNSDRDSPVTNFFPETIEAQYLRIIPTDYNNWISLRAEVLGCYHRYPPVSRILPAAGLPRPRPSQRLPPQPKKLGGRLLPEYQPSTLPEERVLALTPPVTTLPSGPSTPAPPPVLLLCPEMDPKLVTSCPSSCPPGLLCDGKRCVDPVDCVCVHNGIIYQVSDKIADEMCNHCDCALGGHSMCTPKTCPPCPQDTQQKILSNCSCSCEACDEGSRICPTSKECVPRERWCDGLVDCPDDEIDCLVTTTTMAVPVTPAPVENATCDIVGRHINTLDGQEIAYEPCHHIVLQDIEDDSFSVQVHKECPDDVNNRCRYWVEVRQDEHTVEITSDLDVRYDGHSYTASQLVILSHNSAANFTVERVGKQIVFKSITKRFTVLYDINARLKVDVSLELLNKVAGLCGFYSNKASDDQQKPDGQQAYTSQEFGDSWATGDEADCVPTLCPHHVMIKAVESCSQLRETPFSACEDVIDVSNYIESCMSSMCQCLQSENASLKDCHCNSYLPLVEACEKPLGSKLRNWRIKYGCPPKCPPGMEWNDCGPSCQLTCDTPSDIIDQCSGDCMAGCFCPAGSVQNGDVCIPPDHCSDSVCQGFGDPHLETFDGLFFPFQSVGTFLIAADDAINFMIEGVTEQCNDLATITCVTGLMISYREHKIIIARHRALIADEREVPMDDFPLYLDGIIVMAFPGRSFIVIIPPLNIEARYYEENAGFAVKIPSRRYFNKTIGICGNCNAKKDDEIPNDSVSEFVCSWLTDGNEDSCKTSFTELPEVKEPVKVCENLNDEMFGSCHPLIDPSKYIDACSYDTAHGEDEGAALCKTLMEYARQCCTAGERIDQWIRKFGCNVSCPNNLEFSQCHDACPQTCEGKNSSQWVDCHRINTDGCFCPEGKVLKDGACVDHLLCETCDLEGHVPGDTWKKRPCETCHCKPDLSTECRLEVCPQPPLCVSGEILTKRQPTDQSCCESYTCVLAPFECPVLDVPRCPEGQVAKVKTSETSCPEFECVCDVILCPPVTWPQDLEEGQRADLVNISCCPHVEVQCHVELCPAEPTCDPALELLKTATGCCTQYKCKPPSDVCVYVHNFAVVEGLEAEVDVSQTEPKIYKPGDVWQDGLCENCSCVESQGQFVPLCVVEQCPALEKHPDHKDYALHEFISPGQCCPDIYRMQCKDEEGNLFDAEDEWQSKDNPCVVFVCEPTVIGDVQKVKKVIDCPKCQEPSEYIPPSTKLGQCCGICQPAKCQEDDHLFDVGESWTPSSNPCQTAECVKENGTVKTVYTNPSCPLIPDDCPKEKIVRDDKGCCQSCSLASEIKCSTVPIPLEETIGFFSYVDPSHGGECINDDPIPDVLECSGACHSESYYSLEEVDFKSVCMCCKVNITINRTVEMNCPDGARVTKSFLQPANCQCSKCSGGKGKGRQRYDLTQQRETEALGSFQQQQEGDNFNFGQEEEEDNFRFGQEEEEEGNFKFGKESFGRFQQEEEEEDRLQYGQQRGQKLYDKLQQNQESLNVFQQEEEELKK